MLVGYVSHVLLLFVQRIVLFDIMSKRQSGGKGWSKIIIEAATIKIYAPWVHSLKEKRMIVKSLIAKTKNKFNVSIAEVDAQDMHQTVVLGLACVAGSVSHADSMIDSVLTFIEANVDGEIIEVQREFR